MSHHSRHVCWRTASGESRNRLGRCSGSGFRAGLGAVSQPYRSAIGQIRNALRICLFELGPVLRNPHVPFGCPFGTLKFPASHPDHSPCRHWAFACLSSSPALRACSSPLVSAVLDLAMLRIDLFCQRRECRWLCVLCGCKCCRLTHVVVSPGPVATGPFSLVIRVAPSPFVSPASVAMSDAPRKNFILPNRRAGKPALTRAAALGAESPIV